MTNVEGKASSAGRNLDRKEFVVGETYDKTRIERRGHDPSFHVDKGKYSFSGNFRVYCIKLNPIENLVNNRANANQKTKKGF
jgi:hypothetical protein